MLISRRLFDSVHRVRQGCVLAPSLFNACMDWVLDNVVDQSDCGASVGNTKITDLVFADDAVIFAESLEVLVMALEALHEEAKPLGLRSPGSRPRSRYLAEQLQTRPGFRPVISTAQCINVCFWFIPPRLRHQPESEQWWCTMGKPIPAKGLVNFFRMVTHAHPPPLRSHMDFVLIEIERLGSDL
ncbi:Acidic amino acid decarboxylase GADL1 [Chionoecetes opilio]|uniref:Acidic amino acid decarboxylase GADL1 n=1 Tax=Chionoecetes opilio TaxID=41210 RepID=A0A8J4Y9H3_CHIOP|nr:Acidic amino acid decarboxylase GADL1 [Chionoecetes opilio]